MYKPDATKLGRQASGTEAVMSSQCGAMISAIDIEPAVRALSQAQAQQLEASAPNSIGYRR
jgi:hypothetical protein